MSKIHSKRRCINETLADSIMMLINPQKCLFKCIIDCMNKVILHKIIFDMNIQKDKAVNLLIYLCNKFLKYNQYKTVKTLCNILNDIINPKE